MQANPLEELLPGGLGFEREFSLAELLDVLANVGDFDGPKFAPCQSFLESRLEPFVREIAE